MKTKILRVFFICFVFFEALAAHAQEGFEWEFNHQFIGECMHFGINPRGDIFTTGIQTESFITKHTKR